MRKIKTGVVGYGFSGKVFQCPFIEAHNDYELAAVVQRHGDESKKDYPNIELYRDYEKMLKDDTIELVVISTPNHLHFDQAKLALEYDKHVLIEKPFATSYEKALELNALAKEKGKVITAYQNRRYDGDFLTIKKMIDEGVHIYEYEAVWDRFVPEFEDTWKESGDAGSDLLFDLGTHYLDQALTLFGEPTEFSGTMHKLRAGTKINDYFSIQLVYPDKVVRLKSNMIAAKSDIRYKIHTNKGTYHFYEMGEQEHQLLAGMKPDDPEYGDNANYDRYDYEGVKTSRQVEKGNYLGFFTQLKEAIRDGGEPPVTPEEAARLIKYLSSIE